MSFKTTTTQNILNNSGIYFIKNQITKKLYIGSTSSLLRRYKEHFNTLRRKQHHSAHLQASFNKYGSDVFEFGVIEIVDEDSLISQEQYWMDLLKPEYNMSLTATRNPMTEETRTRISKTSKGVPKTPEQAARCRTLRCGTKLTEEHKEALFKKTSKAYVLVSPKNEVHHINYRMPLFAKQFGLDPSAIIACCRGKHTHTKGWQCFYADQFSEDKIQKLPPTVALGSKTYLITTPTGEEITTNNLNGFAIKNNLDPSHMFKILKGKAKTCKGYAVREITSVV